MKRPTQRASGLLGMVKLFNNLIRGGVNVPTACMSKLRTALCKLYLIILVKNFSCQMMTFEAKKSEDN